MNVLSKININGTTYQIGGSGSGGSSEPEIIKGYLSSGSFYTETQTAVDYVEIGGLKWATMNIGANSITDYGLYFQWGDTQGYTASQVGSGEGQKNFGWADYKYGNGTSSPSATDMTKYNSSDGKTVLEVSDDAVIANWGGSWRMPTTAEYDALRAAVNFAWTADYQGSGVAGLVLTGKTDSSKTLFFPACGYCNNGGVNNVGSNGSYLSSSLCDSNVLRAYYLLFVSTNVYWREKSKRSYGVSVRGVWDGEGTPVIVSYIPVTPSTDKLYIDTTTNKMYIYSNAEYVEVNNISVMGASGSNHSSGLVPDPGATAGTSKYLREDGTWQNPTVTSSDLDIKQDKISVVSQAASSFTAAIDKYYNISGNVGTMTITLPTMTDSTKTAGLMILFTTGSSPALTINSASNLTISYFSNYSIQASKSYELNCLWNGTKWIISYGTIN